MYATGTLLAVLIQKVGGQFKEKNYRKSTLWFLIYNQCMCHICYNFVFLLQLELSQILQSLSEKAKVGTEFIQSLKSMTDRVHVSPLSRNKLANVVKREWKPYSWHMESSNKSSHALVIKWQLVIIFNSYSCPNRIHMPECVFWSLKYGRLSFQHLT